MKTTPLALEEVMLIEPTVFGDGRGCFFELFQSERYAAAGVRGPWTQDNVSHSAKGVIRGLHYQWPTPQGKLVSVLSGTIFDVAVDVRTSSPTFGEWVGAQLNSQDKAQLWVPQGFAHGFQALSDDVVVLYKCSESFWSNENEHVINYADPDLGIEWPLPSGVMNVRDANAPLMKDSPVLPP